MLNYWLMVCLLIAERKDRKKRKGLCVTPFCRRKPGKSRHLICNTCKGRLEAERAPMRISYRNLKKSAKRRKKDFDLTYEQFEQWAVETDYKNKRGRQAYSYTVHRVNNKLGYTLSNIAVLTNSENARIGNRETMEEPF